MTFDNGRSWRSLQPPHKDSEGNPIICTGRCSLHLHGWTGYISSSVGPFYSTENAIGLILGNGNVGENLAQSTNDINTFFSRDAGKTWQELLKGPTIYEFGDHGSIIVLGLLSTDTDKIYYTLDEGKTPLKELKITDEKITIINIITERASTNNKFIVIGRSKGGNRGVVVGLDFSQVYNRTCKNDDYEEWTPRGDNNECLLGRKVTYRRRKQTAKCFNAENVEHIVSSIPCPCTEEDWECDLDYERNSKGECVLVGEPQTYPPHNCPPGYSYNKTSGYRLVAGSYCQDGLQLWGEGPFDCPDPAKSKSYGWIAAVVLIPIGLALGLIVFACIAMRNETLREKLPFLKALAGTRIGYFGLRFGPGTMDDDDDELFERHEEDEESIIPQPLSQDEEDSFDPRA